MSSTDAHALAHLFGHDIALAIRAGLADLGTRRLVLAIHDSSFPSTRDEDLGRGSPYGDGARALFTFAAMMGFDGVQLGPQGDTSLDNPSPYDGALFTKSPLGIALGSLGQQDDWASLCGEIWPGVAAARDGHQRQRANDSDWGGQRAEIAGGEDRVRYRSAWTTARRLLSALHARFAKDPAHYPALARRFAEFTFRRQAILDADGTFEALWSHYGSDDWRTWADGESDGQSDHKSERVTDRDLPLILAQRSAHQVGEATRRWARVRAVGAEAVHRHAFGQFVLHEQHQRLRHWLTSEHGVALFGDLPIGFSHRDVWSRRSLFCRDFFMGAPPSRTNPAGQPWGFPVLDPDRYFATDTATRRPGPVMELLLARVDLLLEEVDGLRIDHPHGLVCPWVYRADDPDPAAAVGRGARLFCSPHLTDHLALARFAIPTADQLSSDPGIARYADDWVRGLRDDQVAAYGVLFDALMARVVAAGRTYADVVCEVLSTWPYPLRRVMKRYDLGRFCVLQKAVLTRSDDVYRAENAAPQDWIMVGNHDTPPIWLLADEWHGTAVGSQWAAYLAERLFATQAKRARFARWVAVDARHLCQAMFATLFVSPARHVSVFFADFFGLRDIYNRPGIVDGNNWMLRLPPSWLSDYQHRVGQLAAVNVPLVLALALSARTQGVDQAANRITIDRLMRAAKVLTPTLDEDLQDLLRTDSQ